MLQNILLTITCIYSLLFVEGQGAINFFHNNLTMKTGSKKVLRNEDKESCWMTMNAKHHFKTMEQLEEFYSKARTQYEDEISNQTEIFDKQTLKAMLESRGRIEGKEVIMEQIPAGLNLGGYSMLKNELSVLFFHRMKLRNSTKFRINLLHTDLGNMVLSAQLSLHDLHLLGSYERAFNDKHPYNLYYVPTYGLIEILLKDVVYVMEGRLRFLHDSPYIVLVNSGLDLGDAMLLHKNNASNYDKPISIRKSHIEDFLDRMKADLDSWLKDFFNHYLIFYKPSAAASGKYREFQKKRTIVLNGFLENALKFVKHRLHQVNASAVQLPKFNVVTSDRMKIQLADGVLRGLDSIYRRSIATGRPEEDKIRKVDAIVGFSNLKVIYKYTIFLTTGVPPVNGLFILSADELTAHMSLSLLKDPETAELTFDTIQELKEKSLTVEGPANRIISNFKHILEHHILSLMSNVLVHNIRALGTLTKCEPSFFGVDDSGNKSETEDKSEKSNDKPSDIENLNGNQLTEDGPFDAATKSVHSDIHNNNNLSNEDPYIVPSDSEKYEPQDNYNNFENSPNNEPSEFEKSDKNNHHNNEDHNNESSESEDSDGHNPIFSENIDQNHADYILKKEDSVELELTPDSNTGESKKYHLLAENSLSVKKLN